MNGNDESLYSILGVDNNATLATITKAYRAKALSLHPDRVLTEGPTPLLKVHEHDEFAKVTEAYQTLVDPERRSIYDKKFQVAHQTSSQEVVTNRSNIRPSSSHVPEFLFGKLPPLERPSSTTRVETPGFGSPVSLEKKLSNSMLNRAPLGSGFVSRPPTVPMGAGRQVSTPLEGSMRRVQTPLSDSAPCDDSPMAMHRRWDSQFKLSRDGKVDRRRPPVPQSASQRVPSGVPSGRDVTSRGSNGHWLQETATDSLGTFLGGFSSCTPVSGFDDIEEFPAPTYHQKPGELTKNPSAVPKQMLPFRPPSQNDILPDYDDLVASKHNRSERDATDFVDGFSFTLGSISNIAPTGRSSPKGKLIRGSRMPPLRGTTSPKVSQNRVTPLPTVGGVHMAGAAMSPPRYLSPPSQGGPVVKRGVPSIMKPHAARLRGLSIVVSRAALCQLENEAICGISGRKEMKKGIALRQLKAREACLRAREEALKTRRMESEPVKVTSTEETSKLTTPDSIDKSLNKSSFIQSLVDEADAALVALKDRSARMRGVAGDMYAHLARERAVKIATAVQFHQPQALQAADVLQSHKQLHPLVREHRDNWSRVQARAKTVNTFFEDALGLM